MKCGVERCWSARSFTKTQKKRVYYGLKSYVNRFDMLSFACQPGYMMPIAVARLSVMWHFSLLCCATQGGYSFSIILAPSAITSLGYILLLLINVQTSFLF